jgi:hypothetical protein
MNILNKIFSFLFWGAFVLVFSLIAIIISFDVLAGLRRDIVLNGSIAFFGAFCAFIFLMVADRIREVKKGNASHFNSLVKIERLLNRIISRLEENNLVFEKNLEALKSMKLLAWSSHEIPFNNQLTDDSKNIDFINEYFDFSLDIEMMKNDFVTMKNIYEEIKSLYKYKYISNDVYKYNISFFASKMEVIIKFLKAYQKNTIQLLTKTRLLLKEKKKNWTFLFGAFPKRHYVKNFDKKVDEELKILNKEIEEVRKKSEEEKKKIEIS